MKVRELMGVVGVRGKVETSKRSLMGQLIVSVKLNSLMHLMKKKKPRKATHPAWVSHCTPMR